MKGHFLRVCRAAARAAMQGQLWSETPAKAWRWHGVARVKCHQKFTQQSHLI